MNKVVLVGHVTRKPELRYTQSGQPVANFSIAVQRPTKKGEADFVRIVAWAAQAENCANYLDKGRLVGVEGHLQVRSYEATDGQKRQVVEVVADRVEFLGPKQASASASEEAPSEPSEPAGEAGEQAPEPPDDIPF